MLSAAFPVHSAVAELCAERGEYHTRHIEVIPWTGVHKQINWSWPRSEIMRHVRSDFIGTHASDRNKKTKPGS